MPAKMLIEGKLVATQEGYSFGSAAVKCCLWSQLFLGANLLAMLLHSWL